MTITREQQLDYLIRNGKLVGAVTRVLADDQTAGCGIVHRNEFGVGGLLQDR